MKSFWRTLGIVAVVLVLIFAIFIQVAYAQEETPPVDEILETPITALEWVIDLGGASVLAGMLVSIICWMSPKFNALPSEKKRLVANVAAIVASILAQVALMLFTQKPEWLLAVNNIWKYVVYVVEALIALNVFYLKNIRQQPAVVMTNAVPVQ